MVSRLCVLHSVFPIHSVVPFFHCRLKQQIMCRETTQLPPPRPRPAIPANPAQPPLPQESRYPAQSRREEQWLKHDMLHPSGMLLGPPASWCAYKRTKHNRRRKSEKCNCYFGNSFLFVPSCCTVTACSRWFLCMCLPPPPFARFAGESLSLCKNKMHFQYINLKMTN